jgi:hypothetical protein
VERLAKVYEKEGSRPMSSDVAVQHMGYSSRNGASLTVLAALKKYGLVEGRAEDLRVSRAGIVILSDQGAEDQTERAAALREALVSDALFRELDERFSGRTTEINVISYLQKRGFNPAAARSAAKSYIESAAFVEREVGAYNSSSSVETEEPTMQQRAQSIEPTPSSRSSQPIAVASDFREAPIVISDVSQWPIIRLPKTFSAKNWDDMILILTAMKAGLITEKTPKSSSESGGALEGELIESGR